MTACKVDGCERSTQTRGWCQAHYMRWWSSGVVGASGIRSYAQPLAERFWPKVDKNGPGGCWLWMASRGLTGYGRFQVEGAPKSAHRIAYELVVGTIPEGLDLDHLCRVKHCVNPAHLEPVTNAENRRRAALAQTHCIHGHEYTAANTYIIPSTGSRTCRVCKGARHVRRASRKSII